MKLAAIICLLLSPIALGENLLQNGSFEQRDAQKADYPSRWTESTASGDLPLQFTGEHYQGATAALLPGDGKPRAWRQILASPGVTSFTLSAFVKAEDATMDGRQGYAFLYGHIIYKDRPYADATHFFAKIPQGSYDWKRISVEGAANRADPIDKIYVTVTGQLSSGRMMIDQVELSENRAATPEALLRGKVEDLLAQLDRVGAVDASIGQSRNFLQKAKSKLTNAAPDLAGAKTAWVLGAEALSHKAWAAMFPDAMSDKPVEAHMIYHGIGRSKEECDHYLDVLSKANANGAYLSLGSWMSVVYHSRVLPIEPGWESFDALKYFIDEAHKRNIKVLGYVAALYGTHELPTDPKSIYYTHADWFAHGPDANMPTFPDPANSQVVDFIARIYVELAQKYELDGIGLDYIRYPTESALNYDENNRRQIKELLGIDIKDAGDLWKDPAKWEKIVEYRAAMTRNVIQHVCDAVKSARPGIPIIACLISDSDEARRYGQDWSKSSVLIDYASPMNYDDVSAEQKLLARQREIFSDNKVIYIPAIGGMPQVHESWTISTWAARVAAQRKNGCDGMIIYRIGDLDPAVAAFFGNGPYHTKSKFPDPISK